MSQRDISEVEPEGTCQLAASSKALFLEKVRESNAACQGGDFATAVALYTDAISLDPSNFILYSNRSAALVKMGRFDEALQDAVRARDLNNQWPKAYYRQGVALQCLGMHGDALAAFSSGLAVDPTNCQLLSGLVEAAMKSFLRLSLEPIFEQLEAMKLDKSAFVIISVIGQELLAAAQYTSAVTVLEAALSVGTCSLKLRGSVFSALSSAYWALNSLDKAIDYMQQDLSVAKSLGDIAGECRAHGNLGSAYFSKGSLKEALTSHRYQLVLAMKCKDTQAAATALTSLGHVYTAIGDYPNALASHKQCVQLVKQMNDGLQEAREIGNVGAVYLAMGEFESAVDCHTQHLRLAKRLGNQVEEARAYSNLGSSHHYRRHFQQAITYHENVLRIAQELGDRVIEARAYAGLGHAARCAGHFLQAKKWHEKQLDMALATRDKIGEGRACSNLGIVYQLLGEHSAALKLHQAHLNIAKAFSDRAGMGRAYGNIGNAHSAMGQYQQAIKYHKQELTISKEVNDRNSEACTHGNLAVAYQALGGHDMALMHYKAHLKIARQLKDTAGEACALLNLANCLSSRHQFDQAVPYYENFLMLTQELHDIEGEAKACHFLGYAHYCLGNLREAVRYYDQDLALAKDLQDKMNMGRGYCNLGLAHMALGNLETALECQKYFLAIAHMTKHAASKFRALGNIGDVLIKMGEVDEAIKMYQRQLGISRRLRDGALEAAACAALGLSHCLHQNFDKALGYHTQELALRQELGDLKGECRAHGHLGAVHMSLGNYTHALKCYKEQLDRANDLNDSAAQALAFGNLGITRLNMGHYEDAIGYFEQQLATLEQLSSTQAFLDKGRAFGNLGDCYEALGDLEEAVKCHEQHLAIALKLNSCREEERAYRGLGNALKRLGHLQQALVCFEKRLVVAHDLKSIEAKAAAYGELGRIHGSLGNFEQAISCLEHCMAIAREVKDVVAETDAACGLGQVCQQMGELSSALQYHRAELELAQRLQQPQLQARACSNLAVVYENMADYQEALRFQQLHLNLSSQINDKYGKTLAYSSLGRIHHALGNLSDAIAYLEQGLVFSEQLGRREEEARIRHRLGLALWGHGDLEGAKVQLERAAQLLEAIRREAGPSDYKLSLFHLQTTSYQALQRVLIALKRTDEALVAAERGRTRAFVDLLLERQTSLRTYPVEESWGGVTLQHLLDTVNRQKASILYYSLAAGYLHAWLLVPSKGIVRFHEASVSIGENESTDVTDNTTLLEQYIESVRESLGLVHELSSPDKDLDLSDTERDRSANLRIMSRNHLFNSSNYSLSSLFSLGSVTSGSGSRAGSTRHRAPISPQWQGPQCLVALYDLLIAPFEDLLPCSGENKKGSSSQRQLILVLEGDLYLVPFSVLRPQGNDKPSEYLCERFSLLVIPSLTSLKMNQKLAKQALKIDKQSQESSSSSITALVVGNVRLPAPVTEEWGWGELPYAQEEAQMVAEMLQAKLLTGSQATKDVVMREMGDAECLHFATHVSWKLSAVVLAGAGVAEEVAEDGATHLEDNAPQVADMCSALDLANLSDILLTAADITGLRLSARLVVVSSCHCHCHTKESHCWAGTVTEGQGIVGLTRAFLAAGAQCVLVSLWPVPETATKILLRAFYSALLQGACVSRALSEAMLTVQHTKHFAHPANWAGFVLVGADVRLSSKVPLMGEALCQLLKTPDKCRDALRVSLHLVEKSLQRIHRGQKNAMYTTQKSIENRVGSVAGWKELLMSVGFRFEPAANGIPSSVFFPQSDPDERLNLCSASLQALLGLTGTSLLAISKLVSNIEMAEEMVELMKQVSAAAESCNKNLENESIDIRVNINMSVWRRAGCHELLASLGFDLMEVGVGQDQVTLRSAKTANKRNIHFVLQALHALFDTYDAPKSISLDSCSSLESLVSIQGDNEREINKKCPAVEQASNAISGPTQEVTPTLPGSTNSLTPGLGLTLTGGAFTSYVRQRRRGEPDGRTSAHPEPQPSKSHGFARTGGGGESDAAFTPSPPVHMGSISADSIAQGIYPRRADSSSSASSITDWEGNGQGSATGTGTVVRRGAVPAAPSQDAHSNSTLNLAHHQSPLNRTLKVARTAPVAQFNFLNRRNLAKSGGSNVKKLAAAEGSRINVLDRLSVRTEPSFNVSSDINESGKGLFYFPADEETCGVEKSSVCINKRDIVKGSIQDEILATQLRLLNRELTPTISEVYHERNIGLGLAPPLSKLLIAHNSKSPKIRTTDQDKITNKLNKGEDKTWLNESTLNMQCDNALTDTNRSPCNELCTRDEGDGRSLADSQCSLSSFQKTASDMDHLEGPHYQGETENAKDLDNIPTPRARILKPPYQSLKNNPVNNEL